MTKLDLYRPDFSRPPYWLRLLLSLDQFTNAILNGSIDETISSRSHRCRHQPLWAAAERVINTLFWWDRQGDIRHCEMAYYGEVVREHFPELSGYGQAVSDGDPSSA